MATEQEELRLTVTLDDQASAQLASLRQTLASMSASMSSTGTTISGKSTEAAKAVKGLHTELSAVAGRAGFIGGAIGGITSELAKLGISIVQRASDLEGMSRAMVSMRQAAQELGTSTAQLRSNINAFREAGLSAEQAEKNLTGFTDAMVDLKMVNGQLRAELLTGGFLDLQKMQQTLAKVDTAKTFQEQANVVRHAAHEVKEYWTALAGAEAGARMERKFLNALGAGDLAKLRRDLREITEMQRTLYKERDEAAEKYQTTTIETSIAYENIARTLSSVAIQMINATGAAEAWLGYIKGVDQYLESIDARLRKAKETADAAAPAPDSFWGRLNPFNPNNVKREGAVAPELQNQFPGRTPENLQTPGGVPFFFNGGGGNLGPYSPVTGNLGGFLSDSPESGNIEDRRATEDNTDTLTDLTREVSRLNSNIESPMTGGGAAMPGSMAKALGIDSVGGGGGFRYPGGGSGPNIGSGTPGTNTGGTPGTASYGGDAGGGAAGGVQGAGGAPSGQGLTPGHFATVRYNNPGGMYPGQAAQMFGTTGTGVIGGGHKIANFPTAVHGAAANMQNIVSGGYVGMTIAAATKRWSGGSRSVPGPGGKPYDPNMVITREMTKDPNFVIPFMQSIASGEAPGRYPLDQKQWEQAYDWYTKGGPQGEALKFQGGTGAATAGGGARGGGLAGISAEAAGVKPLWQTGKANIGGLDAEFVSRLNAAYKAMSPEEQASMRHEYASGGHRTREMQAEIYQRSGGGRLFAAAPPGHSRHEGGMAVDVARGGALNFLQTRGAEFGLEGIMGGLRGRDPVHIQMNRNFGRSFFQGGGQQGGTAVGFNSDPRGLAGGGAVMTGTPVSVVSINGDVSRTLANANAEGLQRVWPSQILKQQQDAIASAARTGEREQLKQSLQQLEHEGARSTSRTPGVGGEAAPIGGAPNPNANIPLPRRDPRTGKLIPRTPGVGGEAAPFGGAAPPKLSREEQISRTRARLDELDAEEDRKRGQDTISERTRAMRGDTAADILDGGRPIRVDGNGKIDVNVKAPDGTNVKAEGGGLFKKTSIARETQMSKAESGPTHSANNDEE